MRIIKIDSIQPEAQKIEEAITLLKNGKIVAFPTDTVYGLGVNAEDKEATDRLYEVKKRPRGKPFVLFLEKKEDFIRFAEVIPLFAQKLVNKFWPGPLTLLFKASKTSPSSLVSKQGKIGMRLPSHPVPQNIMKRGRLLLAVTSANLSGKAKPLSPREIKKTFDKEIDLLLDGGETLFGEESSIVDVTSSPPCLVREGWLSKKQIEETWAKKKDILFVCTGNTCRSPMAESILKKMWSEKESEIKIHSAGTAALTGDRPTPLAIKMTREKGVCINLHRSTHLAKKLIKEADLILVMEAGHKKEVLNISPLTEGKVFLLKDFALGLKEEILDPMGNSEERYQKCIREIEESIRGLISRIS